MEVDVLKNCVTYWSWWLVSPLLLPLSQPPRHCPASYSWIFPSQYGQKQSEDVAITWVTDMYEIIVVELRHEWLNVRLLRHNRRTEISVPKFYKTLTFL
jgi:hypothetical protein